MTSSLQSVNERHSMLGLTNIADEEFKTGVKIAPYIAREIEATGLAVEAKLRVAPPWSSSWAPAREALKAMGKAGASVAPYLLIVTAAALILTGTAYAILRHARPDLASEKLVHNRRVNISAPLTYLPECHESSNASAGREPVATSAKRTFPPACMPSQTFIGDSFELARPTRKKLQADQAK